jgi:hypothetical protein
LIIENLTSWKSNRKFFFSHTENWIGNFKNFRTVESEKWIGKFDFQHAVRKSAFSCTGAVSFRRDFLLKDGKIFRRCAGKYCT